jgi:hypothetical protein
VQRHILPRMEMSTNIHLLDCTKITVNLKNERYEGSGVVKENDRGFLSLDILNRLKREWGGGQLCTPEKEHERL